MKFLVGDKQSERHEKIRSFLSSDTALIAAVLAAVDLEWTIRRVLDHAITPGSEAKKSKSHISGLSQYARFWDKTFKGGPNEKLSAVVQDWEALEAAYQLRHDIVHGRQGSSSVRYVSKRVACILDASKAIADFGRDHDADPYRKLKKQVLAGPTRPKKGSRSNRS